MKIELFHELQVHDQQGRLIRNTGLRPSHSFVIAFLKGLEGLLDGENKNAIDINGINRQIIRALGAAQQFLRVDAGLENDLYGIQVGTNTGATAEDNENYSLDTKIADGSGAGQLSYRATVIAGGGPSVVGSDVHLTVSRAFINKSGGTITVKEIGLVCLNSASTFYHLLLRDVISDFDVDDTYTLSIVYTLISTV